MTLIPARARLAMLAGLVLALSACQPATSQDTARHHAYAEDFDDLVDNLKERHPDPFFHRSEAEFAADLDAILADLDTLDDFEAMMRLRVAMAKLGDAHTSVGFYDQLEERGQFPLSFQWFSDGMLIVGATAPYEELLGGKVIAVNETSVDEIAAQFRTLVPETEPHFAHNRITWLMQQAGLHQYFGTMEGSSATFTLEMPDGGQVSAPVEAEPIGFYETGFVYLSDKVDHPTWVNRREDRMDIMFRDRLYPDDGLYLVQYNSCWGREVELRVSGNPVAAAAYPVFADFEKRILDTLASGEVETLVFDLRANGGGSSLQGTRLIEKIAALPDFAPEGKIYVAISEATFSSAVINAMNFQLQTNAIFLGTPSGGTPNHYGEVRVFTLPNSGIEIPHSTNYFHYTDEDADAIYPDVRIDMSSRDLMEGRDPVLDYVRDRP